MKRKFESIKSRNVFAINNSYTKAPKKTFLIFSIVCLIVLIIFGFKVLDANWGELFSSFDLFVSRISDLFKWDWKDFLKPDSLGNVFFNKAMSSIFLTMLIAFSGTIIGVILAIPVSILAAGNIVQNKFINNTAKTIIAFFRTVPSFVYALIFVGYFGQTNLTVTIVLAIFTFSITSKIFFERIEHINTRIFISQQATGAGKFRAFRTAVVPQISNHITSATFYALETNIRYISVIGGVTKFGIGRMIDSSIEYDEWGRVGFLLTLLILTVVFLEVLIYFVKNYILLDRDFILDQKDQKKYNNLIKQISKLNNVNFYIKFILQKDLNESLIEAKNNKDNEKVLLIKQEIKKTKHDFKQEFKNNLNKEKKEFEKFKLENINSKSWFIWDDDKKINIRRDKKYLSDFNFKVMFLKEQMIKEIEESALNEHKEYLKTLTINEVIKKNPRKWIKRVSLYLILFTIFIYSLSFISFHLESSQTIQNTNNNLLEMLKFNWASFFRASGNAPYSVLYLIFETLSIAIVGTLIGAIFAYIYGLLSSEKVVNYYVAKFFVVFTSILRSVPTYIYAIFFITLVGMGPFTATLAIAMGTIGMLTKYNREIFDEINLKIVYQLESTGLNKFQVFKYGIMPQTTSSIVSYIVYRFDINFKEVSVLGVVGAGNMGYLLNSYFSQHYFHEFGALLFGIMLFTFFVEYVSTVLRAKLNLGINPWYVDRVILFFKHKNFAVYKANEYLVFGSEKLDYSQSEAFYSYTNKEIYKKAKEISKAQKIKFNLAWYLSYIDYFKLSKEKIKDYKEAKKIYLEHNKNFNTKIKLKKVDRKNDIEIILNKKKTQIKVILDNLKNKKDELSKKEFKIQSLEVKKAVSFIKKSTKIKLESLDY
ncbi:PhnE/PtxC family ABC transporter permease [Spiroplasma floricola]|uniref:Phosphonate ABC transporter permease n=1 Tax=Spiroplasma floricola 23-6 TaxID=1336749 RepID=A0A2K8SEQ5_9MOLU|nr:ABC transporter permease subunit [Spiroplasma floricola]AUB31929.1 phosphonate ABC transporter permease [Spiroplasma floricola 23-6]